MIEVRREGPMATITLSKPEKQNRLNTEAMILLTQRLGELDTDSEVRVVTITGAGDKAFCAGADISEFQDLGLISQRKQAETYRHLCLTLHSMRTPVLAKVNGIAVGGGMAMVSLAHIAIASENARFGTPEINVGVFPNMVMAAILRSIPRKAALKMILLGEIVGAQEALSMGLVNAVVPREKLDEAAIALAEKLASKSMSVMALGLDSVRLSCDMSYPQALEYLQEMGTLNRQTEDFKEGAKAFIEKREPVWKGK